MQHVDRVKGGRYNSPAFPGAKTTNAMLRMLGKPIRTVLRWQALATIAMALAAGLLSGRHGALSAALGGLVSMAGGLASAVVASLGKAESAGEGLLSALRAEAVKIGLIVVLLWLVLVNYGEVVVLAFVGSFVVTVLIFAMAFFVRDYKSQRDNSR